MLLFQDKIVKSPAVVHVSSLDSHAPEGEFLLSGVEMSESIDIKVVCQEVAEGLLLLGSETSCFLFSSGFVNVYILMCHV
jgi:hypothetical protein